MLYLNCDYNEGAHPAVLRRLVQTNLEQTCGYGNDPYCDAARDAVRQRFAVPDADVQFLVGGTQANATVIAALLRPHQGVLCADSGHINGHETGAVEATGHKVLPLAATDGKLTAAQVRAAVLGHWQDAAYEHMVQPGMVYISFPTELGTLYTKAELQDLYATCQELAIPLFIDGARLGYGLASPACDVSPQQLGALCDVFTVGGTKVGALFGEAVVITAPHLQKDFRYIIKQQGGMLAKGRLLGLQFSALLQDDLYFTIAAQAVKLALQLREALLGLGFALAVDSPTNQQFFVLPNSLLDALAADYQLEPQGRVDATHSCVRICTSWATRAEDVQDFIAAVRRHSAQLQSA